MITVYVSFLTLYYKTTITTIVVVTYVLYLTFLMLECMSPL